MKAEEVVTEARRFLVELGGRLDARLITRQDDKPYLWRGYLLDDDGDGGPKEINAFLHKFVSSDDKGILHAHPWNSSVSFILLGSYRETSATGTKMSDGKIVLSSPVVRDFMPGRKNIIKADTFHRVDLITPEVWTLFIHGPRVQPWGFVEEGTYGAPLSMRVVQGKTSENLPKKIMSDGGGI
jgi:hypothetical protein